MPLREDLQARVTEMFLKKWTLRRGYVVPDSDQVAFANEGVQFEGAVLYADLVGSTGLVDNYQPWFAAEVYKSYLYCAARIVATNGGYITAYDGDRIMAIFIGEGKETVASRVAMKINSAVFSIINPALQTQYKNGYQMAHGIGIDVGPIMAARTGARGANDLVWVGRPANHAAKLSAIRGHPSIIITEEVHDALAQNVRVSKGQYMWEKFTWSDMKRQVFVSNWVWPVS